MTTFYDLWDVESGNSLGTYGTEGEALAVVRILIDAYGPAYAEALDLGWLDNQGNGESIATGTALLERLGGPAAEQHAEVRAG